MPSKRSAEIGSIEALVGHGKSEIPLSRVPVEEMAEYAARSAAAIFELWDIVRSKLEDRGLERHFLETEMPILKVLFAMEECGAAIDENALRNLSADFSKRIEKTEEKVYELSGGIRSTSLPRSNSPKFSMTIWD